MKAMVMDRIGEHLTYCEVPTPTIESADDVIMRVLSCGVCATDLKVLHGIIDSEGLPRILGHEPAGIVTAVGSAGTNVKGGDRVVSATYLSCRECEYCRSGHDTLCDNVQGRLGITVDGGFAEYMRIKAQCVVKIPDGVDEAEACVLPCGAGVPYHALIKRIQLRATDKVLILGVGGVGTQAIQLCNLCGATAIAVDLDEEKLALAKSSGAVAAINTKDPDWAEKLKCLPEITAIFDTIGFPGILNQCLPALKKGGKIVLVGYGPGKELQIEMAKIVLNEYEVYGSRGVGIKDVEDLMELLAQKKFNPVVTRYPLSELNQIIDKINSNQLVGRAVVVP